jgi:hypothetical protein
MDGLSPEELLGDTVQNVDELTEPQKEIAVMMARAWLAERIFPKMAQIRHGDMANAILQEGKE